MALKSDRRLYLTADLSRVVEAGDRSAAYLWATPGSEITDRDAAAFGLEHRDGKVVLPAPRAAEQSRAVRDFDEKAAKKAEDKAAKKGEDKATKRWGEKPRE